MSVFHNLFTQKFKKQDEEIQQNKKIEQFKFYDMYMTALVSSFEWGGDFDKKIQSFMIEQGYQYSGMMGFFISNEVLKAYPCYPTGSLLENGEFSKYMCIAYNGDQFERDYDDIVIGYNNSFKTPYSPIVKTFADKSAYALRAVDAALKRAIRGKVFVGLDESQLKTLGSILGNESELKEFSAVLGNADLNNEDVKALTVHDNRESDILALWDVYVRYRNLYYSTFGVNNVEIQKRERITEAEGSGNDEIVRYTLLNDMYKRRLDVVKKVKEKFNKTITCEIQRDGGTVYGLEQSNDGKISDTIIASTRGANINKVGESNENQSGVE